jgi:hypothetical protein
MILKFLKYFSLSLILLLSFNFSFANVEGETGTGSTVSGQTGGGTNVVVSLANPLGTTSVPTVVGRVIAAVLGLVGSLALVMFIYGGFTWMTAAGNEQSITKGKNIVIWATIGLVVIFTSYALVRFVIDAIGA